MLLETSFSHMGSYDWFTFIALIVLLVAVALPWFYRRP